MVKSAQNSRAYTSFITQRDKVLEALLQKTNERISDQMRRLLTRILEIVSFRYGSIPHGSLVTTNAKYHLELMRHTINQDMVHIAHTITSDIITLKRRAFLLSAVGEAEAILRTTGKQTKIHITKQMLDKETETNANNEHIFDRVFHTLNVVSDRAMRALDASRIRGDDTKQALSNVAKTFPRRRTVKKHKKVLKSLTEASFKRPDIEVQAYIPEDEWQAMVDDYLSEYEPQYRSPDDVWDVKMPGDVGDELTEVYGWEMEQSITHDFVDSVRNGQSEAATQEGITDFMVIAVIDKTTCDDCCGEFGCVDFDGLSTTEITKMTKGEQDAPPFHFNCRCQMAPMLDNMPDLPQSNQEEFDQWLNS